VPSIAYVNYDGPINGYGNVTLARRQDDGWRLQTVDSVRDPREPALALDQHGGAHVSYFDPNLDQSKRMQGGLKYARLHTTVVQVSLPVILYGY
jgi:hypothetical protein